MTGSTRRRVRRAYRTGTLLDLNGAVRDSFAIVKGTVLASGPPAASRLSLALPRPNPSGGPVTFDH